MLRHAFLVFLMLVLFHPLVRAEPARMYEWIQFLPADQERGGYVKDLFALGEDVAVVVSGNVTGRPLFRITYEGVIAPRHMANDAPAQSFAVSPNRMLLANNIYILNLTSNVSLYTHDFVRMKDITTPFTDTEAVYTPQEGASPSFVLAGQRMNGSIELWGITESGVVRWKKTIAKAQTYTNDFGIYWHQGQIVLLLQHKTQGLVARLYSPRAEFIKEIPLPCMNADVSYPKNTVSALFEGPHLVVAGMADEHTVKMCFTDLDSGPATCADLQVSEGSAEHMRLAALGGGRVAVVLGTKLYTTDYRGTDTKEIPNPLPDSFLVCLFALPDGDVLAGGAYQSASMPVPAPIVARFPARSLQERLPSRP